MHRNTNQALTNAQGRTRVVDVTATRLGFDPREDEALVRRVPIEAAVAVEVCGIGYAVMMATPADLDDYAVGFALAEGLVERVDEIVSIATHEVDGSRILRMELVAERRDAVFKRARTRVSESSCGLCGMENLEEVLRPLPRVEAGFRTERDAVARALAKLPDYQPLNAATGAVHAAAFCAPDGTILAAREDVGRHNALDKLVGVLAVRKISPASGFILLSARCSFELVEKTVKAGCAMLVTLSAPTNLAVERARSAGLTLLTLARPDSVLVMCDEQGIVA